MRQLRLHGILVALLITGVVGTLRLQSVIRERRESRYNCTWIGLESFGYALQRYLHRNGQLPGPQFADVERSLADLTYWDCAGNELDTIQSTILGGHDMWGHPLQYQVLNQSERVVSDSGQVLSLPEAIVTSFGDNGRDDRGDGDDLILHVDRYRVYVTFKCRKK